MPEHAMEIRSHLENTVTTLQAAKDLAGKGQYEAAAAHAAESAFHMAGALLLDEEIETSRHGEVIPLIQQVFVNGRRLTKEQGADLAWLFALRHAEAHQASVIVSSAEAYKAGTSGVLWS